jgi:hypothetical protein
MSNKKEQFETLLLNLTDIFNQFQENSKITNDKFNKTALRRARNYSIQMSSMLKQFRALTIQIDKEKN